MTATEEIQWVRENYKAFAPIDPRWSEVVQRECGRINRAARRHPALHSTQQSLSYRTVKVNDDLHHRLRIRAATERIRLQELIEQLLEHALKNSSK